MNHVGTVTLETERLVLRKFSFSDVENFYKNYGTDEKAHDYVNFLRCTTIDETAAFVGNLISRYHEPNFYAWALVQDGEVFGYADLIHVNEGDRSAKLRFTFGSKWWWNGYSTEATKAIRDFAFNTIGIHRLYASHHVDNVSNGTTFIKIGMEPEAILKGAYRNKDGSYSDMKQYSIIANK